MCVEVRGQLVGTGSLHHVHSWIKGDGQAPLPTGHLASLTPVIFKACLGSGLKLALCAAPYCDTCTMPRARMGAILTSVPSPSREAQEQNDTGDTGLMGPFTSYAAFQLCLESSGQGLLPAPHMP